MGDDHDQFHHEVMIGFEPRTYVGLFFFLISVTVPVAGSSASTSSLLNSDIHDIDCTTRPIEYFSLPVSANQPAGFRRRNLLQAAPVNTSEDIGTVRIDPLDHFKKYRGGFDIKNKHYWSSTVFTGVYGYSIALIWLLCGIIYGAYLLLPASWLRSRHRHNNETADLRKRSLCNKPQWCLWQIILAMILMVLAIIAVAAVIWGCTRYHSNAKTIMTIIMDTADDASNTIYNATGTLDDMSKSLATADITAEGVSRFLATTSDKLNGEASGIQGEARKNRRLINKGLKIVFIITAASVSLTMLAVIALSVSGILRFKQPLYLLIILCWVLTILCWIFFGTYFFLERFSGDACTAFREFQVDPDNSSLGSILPCNDLHSAKTILYDVSGGIYDIVNQVNGNISLLRTSSYPDLQYVCNPFTGPPDYLYHPDNCAANTIHIRDIPQVLKLLNCSDTSSGNCQPDQFISSSELNIVQAFTTSIQNLLDVYPQMENLLDCQIVKDAFSEILDRHCKPWKRSAKMTWIATLTLSVLMSILVLTWARRVDHERSLHYLDGTVKPQSTQTHNSEFETANQQPQAPSER